MLGKVLFPVIMNDYAEQIIGCLAGLSRNGVEDVLLFHVLSAADLARGAVSRDADQKMLERWKALLEESGIRADYRIVKGVPWLEIVEEADKGDWSFVMLGSHGSSFLDRMFLGSVTENVVHHTQKPVFIYKLKKEPESAGDVRPSCADVFRKILFVTDFSGPAGRCEAYVAKMARESGQELLLLHVQDARQLKHVDDGRMAGFNSEDTARLETLRSRFESAGFRDVKSEIRSGYAMTEILEYAKGRDASLIVLGKKGRSDVKEMLLGGVAETVIHQSPVPVFLIG